LALEGTFHEGGAFDRLEGLGEWFDGAVKLLIEAVADIGEFPAEGGFVLPFEGGGQPAE
jgi:hypothetical protein